MFAKERMQRICDLVNERKSVRVTELSRLLDISEVTIRRDLEVLSREKRLQRTHGGAISIQPVGDEITAPELIRMHKNVEEKSLIAQVAYDMIHERDTLFLDGSSTVNELAKLIAQDRKRLFVITPSLTTVETLAGCTNVTVLMLSGSVNYRHHMVEGPLTTAGIRELRADLCFIGINGIDASFGFSTPRIVEAELKCEMMRSSRKRCILADHTKFGLVFMSTLSEPCDYVVTDTRLREFDYQWLQDRSTVLFADEMEEKEAAL